MKRFSPVLLALLLFAGAGGCSDPNEPSVMDETTLAEKNPIEPAIGPDVIDKDYALVQRVYNRLTNGVSGDFVVDADEKSITLRGSVPSADAKDKAEKLVQGMTGVERVVNELKIVGSAEE